ncbi:MAG: glycosyltransferase [Microthrixaceae bacterium]
MTAAPSTIGLVRPVAAPDENHTTVPVIAVCIPARNEARTIAGVVATALAAFDQPTSPRGEVIVVDDGSTDTTAAVAQGAGAKVVRCAPTGKGHAMRRAVAATTADIVVFVDGDLASLEPSHIHTLSKPLLNDPCAMLVKPIYRRGLHGRPGEGGRVTELVARPLLQLFWPELAHLSQPLAGEYAIRRTALAGIDLADGYAVELALLVDLYTRFGAEAIIEADLGERIHRNRPLRELTPQARDIIAAALVRANVTRHP